MVDVVALNAGGDECLSDRAFYCDGSNQNYSHADFNYTRTPDGETYSDHWIDRNGSDCYVCDSDGYLYFDSNDPRVVIDGNPYSPESPQAIAASEEEETADVE